jgi:hypothetical protein
MTGGLMQLVASGAQDLFLTGNPLISYFKIVYRRHTNFAIETIKQKFDTEVAFGSRVSSTLSRNGDLITGAYIQAAIPDLLEKQASNFALTANGLNNPGRRYTRWIDNLGHYLLKSVEISIGGNLIDKHYSDWLEIWAQLTVPAGKMIGYRKLIGQDPKNIFGQNTGLQADVVTSTTTNTQHNKIVGRDIFIPLQFWFCRNVGVALPLIALQYNEVRIVVEFQSAENLIQTWAGDVAQQSGIPIEWIGPENFNTYVSHSTLSASLWVDYVFLDADERRRFAQVSHEYLIEQIQLNENTCYSEQTNTIDMTFNHTVKELIWVMKGFEMMASKEWSNFTNTKLPLVPPFQTLAVSSSSSGDILLTGLTGLPHETYINTNLLDISIQSNINITETINVNTVENPDGYSDHTINEGTDQYAFNNLNATLITLQALGFGTIANANFANGDFVMISGKINNAVGEVFFRRITNIVADTGGIPGSITINSALSAAQPVSAIKVVKVNKNYRLGCQGITNSAATLTLDTPYQVQGSDISIGTVCNVFYQEQTVNSETGILNPIGPQQIAKRIITALTSTTATITAITFNKVIEAPASGGVRNIYVVPLFFSVSPGDGYVMYNGDVITLNTTLNTYTENITLVVSYTLNGTAISFLTSDPLMEDVNYNRVISIVRMGSTITPDKLILRIQTLNTLAPYGMVNAANGLRSISHTDGYIMMVGDIIKMVDANSVEANALTNAKTLTVNKVDNGTGTATEFIVKEGLTGNTTYNRVISIIRPPSGGLPDNLLDVKIKYNTDKEAGSIIIQEPVNEDVDQVDFSVILNVLYGIKMLKGDIVVLTSEDHLILELEVHAVDTDGKPTEFKLLNELIKETIYEKIVLIERPLNALSQITTLPTGLSAIKTYDDLMKFSNYNSVRPYSSINGTAGNPVSRAVLFVNNRERFMERPGSYFSLVQPCNHHTNIPESPGINIYSFALKPEDYQPSGTINFSRLETAKLKVTTGSLYCDETKYPPGTPMKISIYAVNYNILRIVNGMGGLAYN